MSDVSLPMPHAPAPRHHSIAGWVTLRVTVYAIAVSARGSSGVGAIRGCSGVMREAAAAWVRLA